MRYLMENFHKKMFLQKRNACLQLVLLDTSQLLLQHFLVVPALHT